MKISSAFPSDYLKAADLDEDTPRTLKMQRIEFGVKIGDDEKPILYFSGEPKGLVLNKTNANIIKKTYGEETDDWIGKDIVLYFAMVEFKGDMVEAIRVRAPKTSPRREFKKPAEPDVDEEGYPIRD
jgi:hypothetical protein